MGFILDKNNEAKSFARTIGKHNYSPDAVRSILDYASENNFERTGLVTSRRVQRTGDVQIQMDRARFRKELEEETETLEREVEEYQFELEGVSRFREIEEALEFAVFSEIEPKEVSDSVEEQQETPRYISAREISGNNQFTAIVAALYANNSARVMLALSTLNNIDLSNKDIRKKLLQSECLQALVKIAVDTSRQTSSRIRIAARKVLKKFFKQKEISLAFFNEGHLKDIISAYKNATEIQVKQGLLAVLPELFDISEIRRAMLSDLEFHKNLRSDLILCIKFFKELPPSLAKTSSSSSENDNKKKDAPKLLIPNIYSSPYSSSSPSSSKEMKKDLNSVNPKQTRRSNSNKNMYYSGTVSDIYKSRYSVRNLYAPRSSSAKRVILNTDSQKKISPDDVKIMGKLELSIIAIISNLSKSKSCRKVLRDYHMHFFLADVLESNDIRIQIEALYSVQKLADKESRLVLIQKKDTFAINIIIPKVC